MRSPEVKPQGLAWGTRSLEVAARRPVGGTRSPEVGTHVLAWGTRSLETEAHALAWGTRSLEVAARPLVGGTRSPAVGTHVLGWGTQSLEVRASGVAMEGWIVRARARICTLWSKHLRAAGAGRVTLMPKETKSTKLTRNTKLIEGIKAVLVGQEPLNLGGKTYSAEDLIARFQANTDKVNATTAAQATLRHAVLEERQDTKALLPIMAMLVAQVHIRHRNDVKTLSKFGLTPRRTGKKSSQTLVVAHAKALATRAKRHTMGKRQKAKVKGTLPAKVVLSTKK
jgi:hypothetical protein